jgi:aquaporin related protein
MLEYETANPGQDSARVGEEFDPESHVRMQKRDTGVSFDDNSMGVIGKDLNGVGRHHENHINGNQGANYGTPKEYGTERRPFSDSPAPPHPNDQFTGLAAGGMHADEHAETPISPVSGDTLVENGGSSAGRKSALRTSGNRGSAVGGGNVRDNTYNNQNIGKDAMHEEYFEK